MIKGMLKLRIPNDHGQDIGSALLAEILRQAGVRNDEWDRLL